MNKKDLNPVYILMTLLITVMALVLITLTFKEPMYKALLWIINTVFTVLLFISTLFYIFIKLDIIKKKTSLIHLYNMKITLPFIIVILDFLKKDSLKYKKMYILINNNFTVKHIKKYSSEDILILMPHCLQNSECIYNITNNIENCKECGKCDINDLKLIFKDKKIKLSVATGGTAARNAIIKLRPRFIIGSACERDLFSGLYEIRKIPVYGIINDRPNGPCRDTKINIKELKEVLMKVLK